MDNREWLDGETDYLAGQLADGTEVPIRYCRNHVFEMGGVTTHAIIYGTLSGREYANTQFVSMNIRQKPTSGGNGIPMPTSYYFGDSEALMIEVMKIQEANIDTFKPHWIIGITKIHPHPVKPLYGELWLIKCDTTTATGVWFDLSVVCDETTNVLECYWSHSSIGME